MNTQTQPSPQSAGAFRFVEGFRAPKGLTAESAAADLERVADQYGAITPRNIVDFARNPETALHIAFEWNDDVAAEKYRLHQATTLTRAICIQVSESEPVTRVYTLTKVDHEAPTQYLPVSVVVKNPDMFEDALKRLKAELSGAMRSVNELVNIATPQQAKKVKQIKTLLERLNSKL